MFLWLLVDVEFHGISSEIRRTSTTMNGVSMLSDEASACGTAFIMSSYSYSGLAMQDLVHRNRKELMTDPKTTSSGEAEQ